MKTEITVVYIDLGKRTNQNFVQIPHKTLIDYIQYKAKEYGIVVKLQEESYTSKCSFIDHETVQKHAAYKGKRIHRGLFSSKYGKQIQLMQLIILRKKRDMTFTYVPL